MKVFEIRVNDKLIKTAGITNLGTLNAMTSRVKRKGQEENFKIDLFGSDFEANESYDWLSLELSVGDQVKINIRESDQSDTPERVTKNSSTNSEELILKSKLTQYRRLKEELKDHLQE